MTFIASVIAKDGIAIIADSLVTASRPIIEIGDFRKYLDKKFGELEGEENKVNIEVDEIISLFNTKPSHTKDYEKKLFKLDNHTVVTTAGNAEINDKRISAQITDLINSRTDAYNPTDIVRNINDFCEFIDNQIKAHLDKYDYISPTTFIFSHYNPDSELKVIYKVSTIEGTKKDLETPEYRFVIPPEEPEVYKVVCDGQNRISELILFGEIDSIFSILPSLLKKVFTDFEIPENQITDEYIKGCFKHCITPKIADGFKINQLTDLSLQQAVDLATLLMKIEIAFQTYTRNIPTVGGVIKIATLSKTGFDYITGDSIVKPTIL